jgi:alpha-tubulin suppressor-like RCC1 family protein
MKRVVWMVLPWLAVACVEEVELGRDVLQVRIAAGPTTTCGEDANGEVLCFGLAESGQLGDALSPDHATTEQCALGTCTSVPNGANVYVISALALARDFGCAIIEDGTQCFGGARYGQLGNGTVDDAPHPVPDYTDPFNAPDALALGEAHGCVLYRDHRVYCWGFGGHGQLGVAPAMLDDCGVANAADAARLGIDEGSTIRCAPSPIAVPVIIDATAIFVGAHGTCVTRETGEVRCMGQNDVGQLGLPASADIVAPSISPFVAPDALALGARHGCVLEAGRLRCFGSNEVGALGVRARCEGGCGPTAVDVRAPVAIDVGLGVTWVLDAHGSLFAFGDAREGALGRAGTEDCGGVACSRSPRRVPLPRHAYDFAGGEAHACAVLSDLTTWCFGRGTEGQTGDAFHTSGSVPRSVPSLHPIPRID